MQTNYVMAAPQQVATRQVMMSAPPVQQVQQVVTEQVQMPEPTTMVMEQMVQPPPKKELRTVQKTRPKTVMTTEQVTTTTTQQRTVPKLVYDVRTITVPTIVTETTRVRILARAPLPPSLLYRSWQRNERKKAHAWPPGEVK
jgi:hypothetical protein